MDTIVYIYIYGSLYEYLHIYTIIFIHICICNYILIVYMCIYVYIYICCIDLYVVHCQVSGNGDTPLILAAAGDHVDVARMLLSSRHLWVLGFP